METIITFQLYIKNAKAWFLKYVLIKSLNYYAILRTTQNKILSWFHCVVFASSNFDIFEVIVMTSIKIFRHSFGIKQTHQNDVQKDIIVGEIMDVLITYLYGVNIQRQICTLFQWNKDLK